MPFGNPISLSGDLTTRELTFTATQGQTLFTITDGYKVNNIDVFRNGVKLSDSNDFTAADGSSVTLSQGANLNDEIIIKVFNDYRLSGVIVPDAPSQTINGDLRIDGNLLTDDKYNLNVGSTATGNSDAVSGCNNNSIGRDAGRSLTSGRNNNFLGDRAGCRNTSGCNNNFSGRYAGRLNQTGCHNNYFGENAGSSSNSASHNNFFGKYAGNSNNSGTHNNYFGERAGRLSSSGGSNNFFGRYAGIVNMSCL